MPKKYNYTKKTGRPTKYTEELANDICKRIEQGESLLKISKDPDMPNRSTIHDWINNNDDFSNKYELAVNVRTENMFDEIEDIADSKGEVQRDRLRIDARKWYLSKVMPKKYGDKLEMDIGGKDGQPIAIDITNTLTKIYGEESEGD